MRKQRDKFHESRHDELPRHGALTEAEAISEEIAALGGDAVISRRRLTELCDGMIWQGRSGNPESAHEKPIHPDLIWMADTAGWEPRIPSLCAYLVKHQGERLTSRQLREQPTG